MEDLVERAFEGQEFMQLIRKRILTKECWKKMLSKIIPN
jgi:hypothetical protein